MAKRVLMVITAARRGDLVSAARSAAAMARESGGRVRMAWMRPLPPPRVDRYDRLVADPDREMARRAAPPLPRLVFGARGIGAGRAAVDRSAGPGAPSPRVDGPARASLPPGTR